MKRLRRYLIAAVPAVALLAGAVVACDDDEDGTPGTISPDAAATDSSRTDASTPPDTGAPMDNPDTGAMDAGRDAALPDLCTLYANNDVAGDAGDTEPATGARYNLIAYRAYNLLAASCEVGAIFGDLGETPPDELNCLNKELLSVAQCTSAGNPLPYKASVDDNNAPCAPDAGTSARLFLHVPASSHYTLNDVDFIIARIHDAAMNTGFSAADADRLRELLRADRTLIVPDAGTADAGFSRAQCD